jgi:flagellar hook-length control protein FliK
VLAPAAARPDAGALPPAQVSASIPQDVGSAAWARSLGQHIAWQAAGNYQTAELHLHPADLGPLQVVLSVENNQADLSFVSREPAVRAAIEAAMPELRAMLAESGISLGQAHVGAESPRDQPQFEPPRQRAGHDAVGTEAAVSGGTLRLTPGRGGAGLVDVFA